MKKIISLIITLLFTFTQFAAAESIEFSGYVRNYSGMLAGNGLTDFIINQNTFNLNFKKSSDNSAFKVNPMIYHDDYNTLTLRLREAYLDLYFDNFDLRVGKQQIVWGKADGVFITDIISPKNLFQFLLPEFDEIRIGVVGSKLNYYIGDNTFEVVWLPVFTPTEHADPNSVWAVTPGFSMTPIFDYSKANIKSSFDNSEVFIKYSALTALADFEFMGGYMWDDDPTMFSSITPNGMGGINLIIHPEHKRISLAGSSFSTTLGPIVLRGEGAYYFRKYFNTSMPQINQGIIQKDYIHYMSGIDFTFLDINLSTQFIQKAIMDYSKNIQSTPQFKDEYNNMMTFLARYSMLNETLAFELFSYYDFEYDDALIRPRILYDFSDNINLKFGGNIFIGEKGLFGQYDKNDMIYAKIIYNF